MFFDYQNATEEEARAAAGMEALGLHVLSVDLDYQFKWEE